MRARTATSIAIGALLLLAQPAAAQLVYGVWGDTSSLTPTDGATYFGGSLSGTVTIDDSGSQPVLTSVHTVAATENVFGGTSTCCLGTTVRTRFSSVVDIEGLPVTGTGTTTTSINWGTVTGWVQQPFPISKLQCDSSPGPSCLGCSSCEEIGLSEGFGPLPPFKDSEFNTDPWNFDSDKKSFRGAPVETVSIFGGMILGWSRVAGTIPSLVPTVPLLGLGLLGAGFLGFGARLLRKRR
jgi:hypothetical protein